MYWDGEETDDTFTLHSPTREDQSSAEDLEHEIEKLNIEISKLQNECSESQQVLHIQHRIRLGIPSRIPRLCKYLNI
jgi:predicted RNase H-like nuclease (RuvC/YqgF family)